MFVLNPILENRHFITDITDITEYYGISYYGILRNITIRNISPTPGNYLMDFQGMNEWGGKN